MNLEFIINWWALLPSRFVNNARTDPTCPQSQESQQTLFKEINLILQFALQTHLGKKHTLHNTVLIQSIWRAANFERNLFKISLLKREEKKRVHAVFRKPIDEIRQKLVN